MKFDTYKLNPNVFQGLGHLKFDTPTAIQQATIPLILEGKDIIGCAETGSGKTGAFCIPLFSQLSEDNQATVLILTPTRELGQQVADFCRELTRHDKGFRVSTIVGGADMRKQKKSLQSNPRIIVGTPGRVTDHLRRGTLKLGSTKFLVLDEGDRMLDMGFAPQLDEILKFLPKKRQTTLFTATNSPRLKSLAHSYLNNPEHIQVGETSIPIKNIAQHVIIADEARKKEAILDELNSRTGAVIIFSRTKHRTGALCKYLKEYGFKVDYIHGGRTQGQRNMALKNFRDGKARILCATDVAARGLDIPQVEHVVNYDLPMMKEDFAHRIGRTARNGAKGEALSFVDYSEKRAWMAIVKKFNLDGVDIEIDKTSRKPKGSRGSSPSKGSQRGAKKFDRPKNNDSGKSFDRPRRSNDSFDSDDSRPAKSARRSNDSWGAKKPKSFDRPRRSNDSFDSDDSRPAKSARRSNDSWGAKKPKSFDRPRRSNDSFDSDDSRPAKSARRSNDSWGAKKPKSFDRPRRSNDSFDSDDSRPAKSARRSSESWGAKDSQSGKKKTKKTFSRKKTGKRISFSAKKNSRSNKSW